MCTCDDVYYKARSVPFPASEFIFGVSKLKYNFVSLANAFSIDHSSGDMLKKCPRLLFVC